MNNNQGSSIDIAHELLSAVRQKKNPSKIADQHGSKDSASFIKQDVVIAENQIQRQTDSQLSREQARSF